MYCHCRHAVISQVQQQTKKRLRISVVTLMFSSITMEDFWQCRIYILLCISLVQADFKDSQRGRSMLTDRFGAKGSGLCVWGATE